MLCLLHVIAKKSTFMRNTQGIHFTQLKLGKKRPCCKSTEKCIHCYPAYAFCTNEMLTKHCNYNLPVLLYKSGKAGDRLNVKIMLFNLIKRW